LELNVLENTVLLTIQSGLASMFSIYSVHSFKTSSSDIRLGVSPHFSADFIISATNIEASALRIYEKPFMVFEEWSTNFAVNVTYTNEKLDRYRYMKEINVVYTEPQHNLSLD
jgi:hypothetical protein